MRGRENNEWNWLKEKLGEFQGKRKLVTEFAQKQ